MHLKQMISGEREPQQENIPVQYYVSAAFSATKKLLSEGRTLISNPAFSFCDMAVVGLQMMLLPVNNFLKEISDIDKEIEFEYRKQAGLVTAGNFIPISEAMLSPMEEN